MFTIRNDAMTSAASEQYILFFEAEYVEQSIGGLAITNG